jgi:hypothetical protein
VWSSTGDNGIPLDSGENADREFSYLKLTSALQKQI